MGDKRMAQWGSLNTRNPEQEPHDSPIEAGVTQALATDDAMPINRVGHCLHQ